MKENVKSMDEEMKMLEKNMGKITNISSEINNTLEKRRGTIQELGEVYRLLKGVKKKKQLFLIFYLKNLFHRDNFFSICLPD